MRTTIRLDDSLLAQAKRHAAARGITLTRLIDDSLRERLGRTADAQGRRSALPLLGDGETLVELELGDNEAVRDLMDGLR